MKIAFRSVSFGRSTKKTWSKRPFRMNSAGRRWIRFAVAATKTSASFSCIQVRNVEKIRATGRVAAPASRAARDRHLDLVDPENRRREPLDGLQGPVKARLGIRGPEDDVHVEPEEREVPEGRDRLDRERFSAARHPHHQESLRNGKTRLDRFPREECLSLPEPVLEVLEPADVVEREAGGNVLEDPRLPGGLLLLGQELVERRLVERLARGEDLRHEVPDFIGGQPAHRERESTHGGFVDLDREAAPQMRVEHLRDFGVVGQFILDDVDLLLRLLRERQARRNEEDVPAPVLQRPVEVAYAPHDLGPPDRGRRKILQEVEARARRGENRVEGPHRILRVGHGRPVDDEPVHDRPDAVRRGRAVEGLGQMLGQPLDPRLLPGQDVDQRMRLRGEPAGFAPSPWWERWPRAPSWQCSSDGL